MLIIALEIGPWWYCLCLCLLLNACVYCVAKKYFNLGVGRKGDPPLLWASGTQGEEWQASSSLHPAATLPCTHLLVLSGCAWVTFSLDAAHWVTKLIVLWYVNPCFNDSSLLAAFPCCQRLKVYCQLSTSNLTRPTIQLNAGLDLIL